MSAPVWTLLHLPVREAVARMEATADPAAALDEYEEALDEVCSPWRAKRLEFDAWLFHGEWRPG